MKDAAKHRVKNHAEPFAVGDSVWYRGERYYVEWAPESWDHGSNVRVSSIRIRPGAEFRPPNERHSFCVHADLLELAPMAKNPYVRQPTKHELERREAAKSGEKDIGDPVALYLRAAQTLEDVYRLAAKKIGVAIEELQAKYGHLNPGQQRMNLGNKLRFMFKKQQITF